MARNHGLLTFFILVEKSKNTAVPLELHCIFDFSNPRKFFPKSRDLLFFRLAYVQPIYEHNINLCCLDQMQIDSITGKGTQPLTLCALKYSKASDRPTERHEQKEPSLAIFEYSTLKSRASKLRKKRIYTTLEKASSLPPSKHGIYW